MPITKEKAEKAKKKFEAKKLKADKGKDVKK